MSGLRAALRTAPLVLVMGCLSACAPVEPGPATRPGDESDVDARRALRRTPLVELFERCSPAVVTITTTWREAAPPVSQPRSSPRGPARPTPVARVERASGFVIHPEGFVLTNSHALKKPGTRRVQFHDGRLRRLRVIARDDAHDVALLKIDAPGPFRALPLGRSDDLLVGEPAIVIGNPFGFGPTLGAGVITGLGRSTKTDFTLLRDAIQTDAGINPGVSGGPLLNRFGEVVGIATSRKDEADGIGFAIPIDLVRDAFAETVAAEGRYGFRLGMEVAGRDAATVVAVRRDSPAAEAGVKPGDVVTRAGWFDVRSGIDYHLALVGRRGGQELPLRLLRDGNDVEVDVPLQPVPPRPADPVADVKRGLDCEVFAGRWRLLPDFRRRKPVETDTTATFGLGPRAGRDHFALRFAGYVKVPADGIYQFHVRSDDGSRLYVGEKLVVDNDGLHAEMERRGFVSLEAGLHSIRLTYFESTGEDALKVSWEGPGIRKREIPASALFRAKRPGTRPASQPTQPAEGAD